MKNTSTSILDEHLGAVEKMQEAETDAFFYTRLRARMEKSEPAVFPLKPAWVIGTLALLLLLNGYMLKQSFQKQKAATAFGVENFAGSYDQTVSSTY